MTKSELDAALDICNEIKRKENTVKTLRETGGVGSSSGEINRGSGNNVWAGQAVVEIEEDIKKLREQLKTEQAIIRRYLEKSRLEEQQLTIMMLRYVDCCEWLEVAARIGYTSRHTIRLHEEVIFNLFNLKLSPDVT